MGRTRYFMTTDTGLDIERIEALTVQLMIPIRNHYQRGPTGRDRAYEVLNALAAVAAVVLAGTAAGTKVEAEPFFQTALRNQVAQLLREGQGNARPT